jgi:hypothetical protein
MNHIHRLQNDIIERDRVLTERLDRTQEFRTHLLGSKFANSESGDRNDWISTQDVLRWLNYIQDGQ